MTADDGDSSSDSDDEEVPMNSLGLAISLCDSLRNNAFLGAWEDFAARNKWKHAVCKPGNTLAQFGQHIKTFESRLAQVSSRRFQLCENGAGSESHTFLAPKGR